MAIKFFCDVCGEIVQESFKGAPGPHDGSTWGIPVPGSHYRWLQIRLESTAVTAPLCICRACVINLLKKEDEK